MTTARRHRGRWCKASAAAIALVFFGACEGPVGPKGDPGETGPPGPTPDVGPPDVGMDADAGRDAGDIPLEPEGLVGRVTDTAARMVAGGRIVLVPAADVAALAADEIDVFLPPTEAAASTVDEPIEDLLDTPRGYPEAVTDVGGVYRFATLPSGPVFVVFVPATTDETRLVGGTFARVAQDTASLLGSRLDIRVSTTPSAAARHVGNTPCLTCHGRHRAFGTAHFVGLTVPGVLGHQQDTSKWPEFDAILERFGQTLHFYDCDGASPGPGLCKISESVPSAPAVVSFVAELVFDASVGPGQPGRYRVTLRNRRGGDVAAYDVDLAYGGALWRSQLLVNIPGTDGRPMRFALPFQYQHQGDDTRDDPRDWVWRDVGSSDFYDHGAGVLRAPAPDTSFDAQCAGCHLTDFSVDVEGTSAFHASAVPSAEGAFDYDGDGRREQINVGCESCHGPGSEHLEDPERGSAIVSPQLLTPGRALSICGACHSSPADTGLPLDAEGRMPRPGIRRSELIARHFGGSEASASDLHASGDARAHRLQYTDHIRSPKYRNGDALVTCTACHDPHGRDAEPHDLYFGIRDNTGCVSCHNDRVYVEEIRAHVEAATDSDHAGLEDHQLVCTLCHMPRTASSGSMVEGLLDEDPMTAQPVQYFEGDLATHRYRPSGFDVAQDQPSSVTQRCGICHRVALPNPPR